MIPITPAGRYDRSETRSPVRETLATSEALASRHRPLATHASLGGDEVRAVRRSLLVALAAVCLIGLSATALTVFSPAMRTALALLGP